MNIKIEFPNLLKLINLYLIAVYIKPFPTLVLKVVI